MTLEATVEWITLTPTRPFRISRTRTEKKSVAIVTLKDEHGNTGRGCASPTAYYGETIETVQESYGELIEIVESVTDPFAVGETRSRLESAVEGPQSAAIAGVEMALHDLLGRRLEVPLYRYLGFGGKYALATSLTIDLGDPDEMADRARHAVSDGYEVLKIKLGSEGYDEQIVETVCEAVPQTRIRVDANGDWSIDYAHKMCELLATYDVEFVEQPVAPADMDGLATLTQQSPLPIAADESCRIAADVPSVAPYCDVVIVKLMKTGGIRGAIEQIHTAHAHGCEVMLGCMLESDVSIAAAAHLVPYATYADLDGALLVSDDPYAGAPIENGIVSLRPSMPGGTGASR